MVSQYTPIRAVNNQPRKCANRSDASTHGLECLTKASRQLNYTSLLCWTMTIANIAMHNYIAVVYALVAKCQRTWHKEMSLYRSVVFTAIYVYYRCMLDGEVHSWTLVSCIIVTTTPSPFSNHA